MPTTGLLFLSGFYSMVCLSVNQPASYEGEAMLQQHMQQEEEEEDKLNTKLQVVAEVVNSTKIR